MGNECFIIRLFAGKLSWMKLCSPKMTSNRKTLCQQYMLIFFFRLYFYTLPVRNDRNLSWLYCFCIICIILTVVSRFKFAQDERKSNKKCFFLLIYLIDVENIELQCTTTYWLWCRIFWKTWKSKTVYCEKLWEKLTSLVGYGHLIYMLSKVFSIFDGFRCSECTHIFCLFIYGYSTKLNFNSKVTTNY